MLPDVSRTAMPAPSSNLSSRRRSSICSWNIASSVMYSQIDDALTAVLQTRTLSMYPE